MLKSILPRIRVDRSRLLFIATACLAWTSVDSAHAGQIYHGDFIAATVTYKMVTEDSSTDAVPPTMFGVPTVGGNTLDFNPVGFDASASGANGVKVTDGQLFLMIESNNKATQAIQNFKINEFGDTTMSGNVLAGSNDTSTSVNLAVFVDIVEVDGVLLPAPIKLSGMSIPPLPVLTPMFTQLPANTPSDGEWQLGVDGGGGPIFFTQWGGMQFVDVQDALVKSGTPFVRGATKISVNIDNILAATSEAGTSATIAKKDFFTITTNIPEPATCSLAMLSLMGALLTRRRR